MLKKNKGFLFVSAVIILSDLLFILLNYRAALEALDQDTRDWSRQVKNIFAITLDARATAMQQLATYVANDPRIGSLFRKGKQAVAAEGGGAGREAAAQVRQALFELVIPSWKTMSARYDVRQLHFHLGPGSTSFLRVHRPEKFGDNMDSVRYTVAAANHTLNPTRGFETGRVYSGIRGVVPVFFQDGPADEQEHVGALEAGTAFTVLLKSLEKELGCHFCVLLTHEHVARNMWPDFIRDHFTDDLRHAGQFVEAATTTDFRNILSLADVQPLLADFGSAFISQPQPLQAGTFALRDYRGLQDKALPASGRVLVWRDADQKWLTFRNNLRGNIIFSVLALLVVETVLLIVWKLSRKKLKTVIEDQTREINRSYERLESLIKALPNGILLVDPETGTIRETNPAAAALLGGDKEKILGRGYDDFIKQKTSGRDRGGAGVLEPGPGEYWLETMNATAIPVFFAQISAVIQGKEITIISLADISEHKEAEYQRTQKEKLQGVLEMAGAICHEINQPMQSISGYAELLLLESSGDTRIEKGLRDIKGQIERLGGITRKLMAITRYETKAYLKGQIIDIDKASQASPLSVEGRAPGHSTRET